MGRPLSVVGVDTEFYAPPGERPRPICLSGLDFATGQQFHQWLWDCPGAQPPFDVENTLLVAFYASAEVGCFNALGWPSPPNIIDLFAEQRVQTNGLVFDPEHRGRSLLAALKFYGLEHDVDHVRKDIMRDLAIRGGPYTIEEQRDLQAYCFSDVVALQKLFAVMQPTIDMPRALHRGRYVAAVAKMEAVGVPVDAPTLQTFIDKWDHVRWGVRYLASARYENVYDDESFSSSRFERYLARRGWPWKRLPNGRLRLDDDTFADAVKLRPSLKMLHDTRRLLNHLKPSKFTVGHDGRNRALLSPFASKTGRNQPQTSKFVLASSGWLRGLIRPEPGQALAYIDWKSAEFGIAAALSGDEAMMAAYASGDPYLWFAKRAGRVAADGVRADHEDVRAVFKVVVLAVGYGQGAESLGEALGIQTSYASELLTLHRKTFPRFWEWSDSVSATAHGARCLRTRLGWPLNITELTDSDRSVRNFPVQASCADLLQAAAVMATGRGVRILAPVHDAFLIEAAEAGIESAIATMRSAMQDASIALLRGFALETEVQGPIVYPARFQESETWLEVMKLVGLS